MIVATQDVPIFIFFLAFERKFEMFNVYFVLAFDLCFM